MVLVEKWLLLIPGRQLNRSDEGFFPPPSQAIEQEVKVCVGCDLQLLVDNGSLYVKFGVLYRNKQMRFIYL